MPQEPHRRARAQSHQHDETKKDQSFKDPWSADRKQYRRRNASPRLSMMPAAQEKDPHRLKQRQKQIDFGKNTNGYDNYRRQIPLHRRKRHHMATPDKHLRQSKRSWDHVMRKWRKYLHQFDHTSATKHKENNDNIRPSDRMLEQDNVNVNVNVNDDDQEDDDQEDDDQEEEATTSTNATTSGSCWPSIFDDFDDADHDDHDDHEDDDDDDDIL